MVQTGATTITYKHETNTAVFKSESKELERECKEVGSNSPSN
jgi:hypothetical protein